MGYVRRDADGSILGWTRWRDDAHTDEIADDHADMVAFRAGPESTYREKRKAAYIAELGKTSNFLETVGDVMDDLIREVAALSSGTPKTSEFRALVDKVDNIKRRYPKPRS